MKPPQWMARLAFVGGIGALAWSFSPENGGATPASFHPLSLHAVPSYLQQPSAALWSSATVGGSGRSHLPTSVMPNGTVGLRCSVDATDPGTPPTCSTASTSVRCSAHCDNQQICSALVGPFPSGPSAVCSALGGTLTMCSVLQPNINPAGPSQCSVFGGDPSQTLRCSIMGPGGKQACSAQNPALNAGNQCSTFTITGSVGPLQCSVLKGGPNLRNRCSAGDPVPAGFQSKQCSVFVQNSSCSVMPGNRSFCTTFAPAPAGSCSIFATGATCSVIGGTNGAFCKWP